MAESLSRAGGRQVGLVSVGVTWDQEFNWVRIPESSTQMGAENTWILSSKLGWGLEKPWSRVQDLRMPWSQSPALGLSVGDRWVPDWG